jgi:hypothetical protein
MVIGHGFRSHQHPLCGKGVCRQQLADMPEGFSVGTRLFVKLQQAAIICLLLFKLLIQALLVRIPVKVRQWKTA